MGFLSGALYGAAGGVIGGSEAVGQAADDEIKKQNLAFLNSQMADLDVQKAQRIADIQQNLAANARSRQAGYNVTGADGQLDVEATKAKAVAGGESDVAAAIEKAYPDKILPYGGALVKDGNVIAESSSTRASASLAKTQAGILEQQMKIEANAAKNQNSVQSAWAKNQEAVEKTLQGTLGHTYLVEPSELDPKGVPDNHYDMIQSTLANAYMARAQASNPDKPPSPFSVAAYVQANSPGIMAAAESRALAANPNAITVDKNGMKVPDYSNAAFMASRKMYAQKLSQHFLAGPQSQGAAPAPAGGTPLPSADTQAAPSLPQSIPAAFPSFPSASPPPAAPAAPAIPSTGWGG